jgi:glycosyltransferase involved in cell wall biosynthesis
MQAERRMHATAGESQVFPDLSLVMPCYNEEACLQLTATELAQAFAEESVQLQLVLVDNGSRDRTGQVIDHLSALGLPITKATVPVNLGYGYGVLQGLNHCTAPLVGYLCADGQVGPKDVLNLYRLALATDEPMLAKVRRRFRKDSWRRKLISIIYNAGMQCLFGWLGSIDLNGNPKILRRENLLSMGLQSRDWFLDPEIMIKSKRLRLKVVECDVEGQLRQGGKSNVRLSTCFEFLKNIVRYRMGPLRVWQGTSACPASACVVVNPEGDRISR